ncbi:MAG: nickel-dependent hydrogenase large subunit [Aeromicrobium sp.]
MSTSRTLRLEQVIDGAGAVVEVRLGADGSVVNARLAMGGMPRIEHLLVGKPVVDVPGIVERLCGICPVAHHLAGIRALEALYDLPRLTPTADVLRRLLHHGAVLQTHAQSLAQVDSFLARDLNNFARSVVRAAGADSHFPRCAVLGGVRAPLAVSRRDELLGDVEQALARAVAMLGKVESRQRHAAPTLTYDGHEVALVDATGALDLYGDRLRAVGSGGAVTIAGARADEWPDLIAESAPGSPASRPYLRMLGVDAGRYRVGPNAELRAATSLITPLAETARQLWLAADGGAIWARAVVALHVVEVIEGLLRQPELVDGPVRVEPGDPIRQEASGWVDGARGLLVHTYRTNGSGALSGATITTPTAQNESWLAGLLGAELSNNQSVDLLEKLPATLHMALEAAVLEADPCLPCSSLPIGQMRLRLMVVAHDSFGATRERN